MICRMCLLESVDALSIFENDSAQLKKATVIARHFWFELTKDDPISNMICNSCWTKIEDFHIYYMTVEETQKNLPEILSIKEESVQFVHVKDETAISDVETGTVAMEKFEVFEVLGEGPTTFADAIVRSNDDFSSSDDEILAKWKSTDCQVLKLESAPKIGLNILNLENNLQQTNEIDVIDIIQNDTTATLIQSKRGRKAKSVTINPQPSVESEYRKRSKKSDEEIAQQTKLKCDLCFSEFAIFSQLQKHYRVEHQRKGYVVCCTKKFFKRGEFLDHISQHVNPECFKCNECNKVYANRRSLQTHTMNRHPVDITLFKCDQCPRRFAKSYLLNKHKRNIHAPKAANTFFCEECGKGFDKKMSLQTHRRCIHDNAYTQMCHICAKVIRGKTLFAKHQLEHAGISEPKQQCQECLVWLKNAYRLKLHMKMHTETENEHICNICGKSSPSSIALQSHIRYVHSAKRQHQCSFCDKAFKKPLTLKEHMATHTGDILYTCPHCPKTFNSKSNMHSHRKKMHRTEWEETRKNRRKPPELLNSKESDQAEGT